VQAAGGAVRAAAELAAGVEPRVDELDPGQAGPGLDVHRDPAAVVPDLDGAVGVQLDLDARAVAAEGLVDGVVDDLPQAVHETAAVRGADVHPRPLADGLQAVEHREMTGRVPRLRANRRHPELLQIKSNTRTQLSVTEVDTGTSGESTLEPPVRAVIHITFAVIPLWAYSEHGWEGLHAVRCCPE